MSNDKVNETFQPLLKVIENINSGVKSGIIKSKKNHLYSMYIDSLERALHNLPWDTLPESDDNHELGEALTALWRVRFTFEQFDDKPEDEVIRDQEEPDELRYRRSRLEKYRDDYDYEDDWK